MPASRSLLRLALACALLAGPAAPAFADAAPDAAATQAQAEMEAAFNAACALVNQQRFAESYPLFEQALAIARRRNTGDEAAWIDFTWGTARILAGETTPGLQQAEGALAPFRRPGREAELAGALRTLGDVLYTAHQLALALPYHEQARDLHRALGDEAALAVDWGAIGTISDDLGRYESAIAAYNEAIALAERRGELANAAIWLNNVAVAYSSWGRWSAGIPFVERSVAIARQLKSPSLANRVANMANLYNDAGRYGDGHTAYTEAVALYRRAVPPAPDRLIDALKGLARAGTHTGRMPQAEAALAEALALAKSAPVPGEVGPVEGRLGRLYWEWDRYGDALAHTETALAEARRSGDEEELDTALMMMGRLHEVMGRVEPAGTFYAERLTRARAHGDSANLAQALDDMGTFVFSRGRFDEALALSGEALAIARRLDRPKQVATCLNSLSSVHQARGRYREAEACLQEALALDERLGDTDGLCARHHNMAMLFDLEDRPEAAMPHFTRALALARTLSRPITAAIVEGNMGGTLLRLGRIAEAQAAFDASLATARKLGNPSAEVTALRHLGALRRHEGRYGEALGHFQSALAIARRLNDQTDVAALLTRVGTVYTDWNQPEKALTYFDEAFTIEARLGRQSALATLHNNRGAAYAAMGRHEEAAGAYRQAMAIDEALDAPMSLATDHANLGHALGALGRTDEALAHYRQALALNAEREDPGLTATLHGHMGAIQLARGDFPAAADAFEQALAIDRRLGRAWQTAVRLSLLGQVRLRAGEPARGERDLREAIGLFETVRRTATGDARRDFMAAQALSYQLWVSALLRLDRLDEAFEASELSRAKVLAESIAGKDVLRPVAYADALKDLGPNEAALMSANAGLDVMAMMVLTRGGLKAVECDLRSVSPGQAAPGAAPEAGTRGVQLEDDAPTASRGLEALVGAFRAALTRPDARGAAEARRLGRVLYDAIVAPVEPALAGKDTLVVVPDGVLGMVPFEALVDARGRYLGDRFRVSYTHSLTVRSLIAARKHPAGRKPLLAFGGAVYNPAAYRAEMPSERQIQAVRTAARGGGLTQAYQSLGLGAWSNLPGTLSEVRAIAARVPGAQVVTGPAVNEAALKAMDLGRYRVLHFATHGLVVPQAPELSALVLSQGQKGQDDGYLRTDEVAKLKLQADFVALSACETGLGKVYGGEGVVGLSQAFLVAGANGLSMSLWSVADASTATFMAEVYRVAAADRIGYGEAIARTKRRFARGDFGSAYRHPFYWAPFVYYGR